MTVAEQQLFERVHRRAQRYAPELRSAILAAFDRVRESMTERQILAALAAGGEERLFAEVLTHATIDAAMAPVRDSLRHGVIDSARAFLKDIPRAASLTFDFLNPRVIDAIRTLETRVITTLSESIRESVREVVKVGLEQGKNPRAYAPLLRESVGLAPNMVREIQNYRDALEGKNGRSVTDYTLRDKRFTKAPTTPEQVDKMVAAYQKRRLAQHAETIARTASLNAMKAGQRQSWEDAIAQGVVQRDRLTKTWVGVMDSRERPEHRAMEGQTVGFDALFVPLMQMVPGESDYNCRCIARYVVV